MHKVIYSIFIILLTLGCSSGKKQLERGDYYEAVIKSVNRLKNNPDHKKSKETLRHAYPLAVESLTEKAEFGISSNSNEKWRNAVDQYKKLYTLYNLIKETPGARYVIPDAKSYFTVLSEAKNNAAEESYSDGIKFLNRNNRMDAKIAFYHFQDALEFVPNYKDAEEKLDEARFEATVKVVIEQIPVPTRYSISAQFFQDKVEEYLKSQNNSRMFVMFYTPNEVEQNLVPYIDQILRIQFEDFVVGQEIRKVTTDTFEKDSVKVGEVTLDDGTIKTVFGTVKAKLSVFNKQVKSEGLVSMRIINNETASLIKLEKFSGTYIWQDAWANFNGDERALTPEQLRLCNKQEMYPPPPQDMFVLFTEPIYSQLTTAIRQFYKD